MQTYKLLDCLFNVQDLTEFPEISFKTRVAIEIVFWVSVIVTEILKEFSVVAVIELGLVEKFVIFGGVVSIVVVVVLVVDVVVVLVVDVVVVPVVSSEEDWLGIVVVVVVVVLVVVVVSKTGIVVVVLTELKLGNVVVVLVVDVVVVPVVSSEEDWLGIVVVVVVVVVVVLVVVVVMSSMTKPVDNSFSLLNSSNTFKLTEYVPGSSKYPRLKLKDVEIVFFWIISSPSLSTRRA